MSNGESNDNERGLLDTIRGWIGERSECRNGTDKEMTVCVQDKEASKPSSRNPTGSWKGETKTIPPRETLKVDSNKQDIEGVMHPDGSVTKHHGNFWTSEHDKKWVEQNWPGCSGKAGQTAKGSSCSFLLGDPAFTGNASPYYTFARVDSRNNYWNESRGLEPNTKYRVIPRTSDRWTINAGANFYDFHGGYYWGQFINGYDIDIPKVNLPIAGLIVLVWHHQADGSAVPQIIDFPLEVNAVEFSIDQYGGSIHFVIADLRGCYADNFGDCLVAVARV